MSIYGKIAALTSIICLGLGLGIALLVSQVMQGELERELGARGRALATALSGAQLDSIINGDPIKVFNTARKTVEDFEEVAYVFIEDFDGRVFAHSFEGGFPAKLRAAVRSATGGDEFSRVEFESSMGRICDISRPLIEGTAARVHIGLRFGAIDDRLRSLQIQIFLFALGIAFVAAVVSFFVAQRITGPLRQVVQAVSAYGEGREIPSEVLDDHGGGEEVTAIQSSFKEMIERRREAEFDLRESEERYARAVAGANDGIWDWNIETGEDYFSPRWEEIVGYDPGEIVPVVQSFIDLVHPDDSDLVSTAVQDHLKRRIFHDVEFRLRHKKGHYIWVRSRGQAVWDGDGKPLRMAGSITDITEHKRAQEALRESEALYRDIFDEGPGALWIDDWSKIKQMIDRIAEEGVEDWRAYFANNRDRLAEAYDLAIVLECSKTNLVIYGASSREALLVARPAAQVLPSELDAFAESLIGILEGKLSGVTESLDSRMDGTEFVVRAQYVMPPAHRRDWSRIIHSLEDVTDRKRAEDKIRDSERRLQTAAKMAKLGYFVWDLVRDRCVYCSEEYARMHGMSVEEYIASVTTLESDSQLVHPEDRARYKAAVKTSMENMEPFELEYRILGKDGQVRYVREQESHFEVKDGVGVMTEGTLQDITETKQAEEQLRQAQKMEAVGQLTAGVAHDFNNMLAVISGNAELLEDEIGNDKPQLATVLRATERGAELTQRLLAFSRKQVLNPTVINANDLIGDNIGLLRRTLEEHIDIEAVTNADLWNCEVDPAQLENALVNLAINARDAMPDGGKLTIETANARLDDDYAAAQAEVTPGQYVMLAVTDNGSGMPSEVREHVFEPFFTTKEVGAGSGLGLSMVYGFVKQSGGHVTIYSEPGEGTTIKLYLPRSTETEAVERKPATDEVPVARGETVLVVEDDPDVRTLAVSLLSSLGYQIMEAATGSAALEQLGSTTRVNLLLTDVMLPAGMNGRELAAEAEQCAPGLPVLYMSGYTEDAIMHHGRLDADAELLQKPFRRADLARAVRKALDGPSA